MRRISRKPFSPELWDWAFDRIPRIAAAFHGIDQEELQAELALTLLQLQRKPPRGILDWKSYLAKSLLNRASKLAKRWRRQREIEIGSDQSTLHDNFVLQVVAADQPDPPSADEFQRTRRRLSRRSFAFLRLLDECHGSVSDLARKLGQHRNTVGQRLRRIREYLRSIENVCKTLAEQVAERLPTPPKQAMTRRARIVQALADGRTCREIEKALGVSQPAIARWRHRFEDLGLAGLQSKSRGRCPSDRRIHFESWLRTARPEAMCVPLSALAKRFGLGKTTVHRIIKAVRR